MNIDVAFEALWNLAIFRYGGFEFEAVSDKWLYESDEEEGECTKQGNKLRPDNNSLRKDASASAKLAHTVHCFWKKCFVVFDRERLQQM